MGGLLGHLAGPGDHRHRLTSPGRSAGPPGRSCARRSRPAPPEPARTSWPGQTGMCAPHGTPFSEKFQGESVRVHATAMTNAEQRADDPVLLQEAVIVEGACGRGVP